MVNAILLLLFLLPLIASSAQFELNNQTFPVDFSFGAATAAYQIEGAWNAEGKGESIWDHFVHTNNSRILDGTTGDVACDSYHKYAEDVELAAKMGLTHYRFSISWSRVLPLGFKNEVNLKGISYYQNLIRELEKNNITPMVTIYHWDLPQSLQELGGWTNSKIVDYFKDYAEVVFTHFPTVKYWITINEPKQVCESGYAKGNDAPGIEESGEADYICAYNVIKAHAAVYHLYHDTFNSSKGKVTLGLDGAWAYPTTESDTDAVNRKLAFEFGLYADPIFHGDWPDLVKERVNYRSDKEGFTTSRLPAFTKDERKAISNTADYVAFNFYNTKMVNDTDEASFDTTSFDNDLRIVDYVDPQWSIAYDGNTIHPDGLRAFLKYIKNTYSNPEIIITENGIADDGTTLDDYDRIYYLADYLGAVLDAIHEDQVDVTGYTMWSLLDNFEWAKGYSLHYGFYSVDFSNDERPRSAKKSVDYFTNLIKNRQIPDLPVPPTTTPPPTSTTESPTTPVSSATAHAEVIILTLLLLLLHVLNI